MRRRSAMDKLRFRGRTARGSRPSEGSFSAWKLGRGSERFRAWQNHWIWDSDRGRARDPSGASGRELWSWGLYQELQ